jgi:hypothetical protein
MGTGRQAGGGPTRGRLRGYGPRQPLALYQLGDEAEAHAELGRYLSLTKVRQGYGSGHPFA